jgi:hypothetical protein
MPVLNAATGIALHEPQTELWGKLRPANGVYFVIYLLNQRGRSPRFMNNLLKGYGAKPPFIYLFI